MKKIIKILLEIIIFIAFLGVLYTLAIFSTNPIVLPIFSVLSQSLPISIIIFGISYGVIVKIYKRYFFLGGFFIVWVLTSLFDMVKEGFVTEKLLLDSAWLFFCLVISIIIATSIRLIAKGNPVKQPE